MGATLAKQYRKINAVFLFILVLNGCGNESDEYYCEGSGHEIKFTTPSTHTSGDSLYPTILFIPGQNGFMGRSSIKGMSADMEAANQNGFAAAAINYERAERGKHGNWATMLDDVSCAIRYLKTRENVDPDKIGLMAHSLGGMPASAIVAGIRTSEIMDEIELEGQYETVELGQNNDDVLNPSGIPEEDVIHISVANPLRSSLLGTNTHSDQNETVAAAVLANTGMDYLAGASKLPNKPEPQFIFSAYPERTTIVGDLSLTCSNYKWEHENNLGIDYDWIAKDLLKGLDLLECNNGTVTTKAKSVNIDSMNVVEALQNSPDNRNTRGSDATPILIFTSAKDDLVPPFNSYVTQSHLNESTLNRLKTPLVEFKNAPHNLAGFNTEFIRVYLAFFKATLMNQQPHSNIDYCDAAGFDSNEEKDSECAIHLP